jgi:hypothetical protein
MGVGADRLLFSMKGAIWLGQIWGKNRLDTRKEQFPRDLFADRPVGELFFGKKFFFEKKVKREK